MSRFLAILISCAFHSSLLEQADATILIVGSINMDIIIDVDRLPQKGETVTARLTDTGKAVPGGKGANQAVAISRLCADKKICGAQFICRWGNDMHAEALEKTMIQNSVDVSACGKTNMPSGQGLVFLGADGFVSSVVVTGANAAWPEDIEQYIRSRIQTAQAVMLQREIPEHVNVFVAEVAASLGIPLFQDAGGADRPISDSLLAQVTFITPNLSELARLTGLPTDTDDNIVKAARSLQGRGAKNVLVTRGEAGSLLLGQDGRILRQTSFPVPGGQVVDETGAGDSFRAAFAVAFVEGRPLQESLRFAAAAGAVAVARMGAVPSLPSRQECERLLKAEAVTTNAGEGNCSPSGKECGGVITNGATETSISPSEGYKPVSLKFASRLNSMSARPDLWPGDSNVLGWVARQGTVRGLGVVDFNYPQHFTSAGVDALKAATLQAGLEALAIQMRFPDEFRLGAFTNPNTTLWRKAIELTIEGGAHAKLFGARELVVWSAYDGYDYPLQADYDKAWNNVVEAFRQVCDAHPDLRVSIEHKPTDASSRFSIVPSAGAAKLLVAEVARPNMGITIDVGHCVLAGENPAQSAALFGPHLFGVHLNDGHSRLGAEDGLMFGTVHSTMALELMYWLQQINYQGHLYFDTFPHNEDPVRECEFNIRRAKTLWQRAEALRTAGLGHLLANHDALAALELLEQKSEL